MPTHSEGLGEPVQQGWQLAASLSRRSYADASLLDANASVNQQDAHKGARR